MPIPAKQTVDITSLIKGILNGYPGNSAIFREYLQNSDDAKATKQIFVLDDRRHPTDSVVDPILADTQGPALIAWNDKVLSNRDWNALKKIHASSKGSDETQTGKNGLGFRASYHLTENPQILSGRSLLILDPHDEFHQHPGGTEIDIVTEGAQYADQLRSFESILKEPLKEFQGTVFRLPFRTKNQASRSRIKDTPTSVAEMKDLLVKFGHELEEAILFLKHITSIEIRQVSDVEEKVIGAVTVDPRPDASLGTFTRRITTEILEEKKPPRLWKYCRYRVDRADATVILSKRLRYDVGNFMTADKLTADVELALLLDLTPVSGRLFTLLPLPIQTGFPVHFNAVFALTPDRQSLKNIEESGTKRSRERRLIEWNRTIFDDFGVEAWARLLSDLAGDIDDVWSAWPQEPTEKNSYWKSLLPNMIQVAKTLKIFPIISSSKRPSLVSLTDQSVLLAPQNPPISLDALAKMGITIVQPPSYILNILTSPSHSFITNLSPASLYKRLRSVCASNQVGSAVDVEEITNYLVFWENTATNPALERLIDLPWFTFMDGSPTHLYHQSGSTGALVVPGSEEETLLFDVPRVMLSWPCISNQLRDALSTANAREVLNVATITSTHILPILKARFLSRGSEEEVESSDADISWLLRFWKWTSHWNRDEFNQLARGLGDLHILPTASGTRRRWLNLSILLVEDPAVGLLTAWRELGISVLHTDLAHSGIFQALQDHSIGVLPASPQYLSFLARNYRCGEPSSISSKARTTLRSSIRPTLTRPASLSMKERKRLSALPIFFVHTGTGGHPSLHPIHCSRRYIKVDNDFPLPVLSRAEPLVYVDMNDALTGRLAQLVDASTSIQILNGTELLKLAVDHWSLQPQDLMKTLIERILDSLLTFPTDFCEKLKGLAFITVEGQTQLAAPRDVIDPASRLAELFEGEPGKLPGGGFSSGRYLMMMQSQGFFRSKLDPEIVAERLGHLASSQNDRKAVTFLNMLNDFWDESLAEPVIAHQELRWMPLSNSPSKCREDKEYIPHQHSYLYDHVFTILRPRDCTVSSPGLRKALGWSDVVPFEVLAKQFSFTIRDARLVDRTNRLKSLVSYFANYPTLSSLHFDQLREIVKGLSWVPVHDNNETTSLMQCVTLSATSIGRPFYQAQQASDARCHEFLAKMGCTDRPSIDTLAAELGKALSPGSWSVSTAVSILHEIGDYHQEAISTRSDIHVPSDSQEAWPLADIYYQDMMSDYVLGIEKCATHPQVSRELAGKLGIPLLSSLQLEDGDDDDELQMSEDLVGRIRGFLQETDVQFALNEFLANADDSGAKRFCIKLVHQGTCQTGSTGKVISPEFRSLENVPCLIMWNDSLFTKADFEGIRRVGYGGKTHRGDTHGRYGLGALAMYYFTDVPIIISGDRILILDPSSQYLPPRHGQKRTSLSKKLSVFMRQFPDQLRLLHDNFGFARRLATYEGTLFFLPLRTTISGQEFPDCGGLLRTTYRDLAANAFFFTGLTDIKVEDGTNTLWHMRVIERTNPLPLTGSFTHHLLQFTREGVAESWVVAASNKSPILPSHCEMARELKFLPNSTMPVQLAIRVDQRQNADLEPSHLFSTLRLPKITSLPFHLHARFAVSANRQDLIFHTADQKNREDAKSDFNTWILRDLVCPLYLAAFGHIIQVYPSLVEAKSRDWLIFKSDTDGVSSCVRESILEHLPRTDFPLFASADRKWLSFQQSVFSYNEPQGVRDALAWLKAPSFVSGFQKTGVPTHPGARTVTSTYVMEKLRLPDSFLRVEKLLGVTLAPEKPPSFEHLATLAQYVQAEKDLVGLSIIVATTGSLYKVPSESDPPIYVFPSPPHRDLFPTSVFMREGYQQTTINALTQSNLTNIQILTSGRVADLIAVELATFAKKCESPDQWLRRLWHEYDSLPGPPSISSLQRVDLKIIESTQGCITVAGCTPENVVQFPGSDKKWIVPIMQKLGINVLKSGGCKVLRKYVEETFPGLFINVIKCLMNKGSETIDSFGGGLDKECHILLSEWMRNSHPAMEAERERKLKADELRGLPSWLVGFHRGQIQSLPARRIEAPLSTDVQSVLRRLPIWEAHYEGQMQFLPVHRIKVLPANVDLQSIEPYLTLKDFGMVVSSESINKSVSYYTGGITPVMTIKELFDILELPNGHLQGATQIKDYKKFLQGFLLHGCLELRGKLRIPDDNLVLRLPDELFSHQVTLFMEALKYTPQSSFIHEAFRDLTPELYGMGLRRIIDFQNFQACAKAVELQGGLYLDADATRRQEIVCMADSVFQCYSETLPAIIKTDDSQWGQLDNIAFVRRKSIGREGVDYDTETYGRDLSPFLPPSKLLRPEFEPIAWAVRGLFFTKPSNHVLAVNKSLGVPGPDQVVEHLIILSTKIAMQNPGNTNLLSDLRATYKWLDLHREEVLKSLSPLTHVPLFLNVDDPQTEAWGTNWMAANQLVLNLRFDLQKYKVVRKFLQPYGNLLLAAGCNTITKQPSPLVAPVTEDMSMLREAFNRMRSQRVMTDMKLVPKLPLLYAKCDNIPVGGLPAHMDFLAASIPGFRTFPRKIDHVEITIARSPFVVKAILDFTYTGSLNYSAPESEEDKIRLLRELCELLYQSHEWDMPNLKRLIQKHIINDHDMVQELPQAFRLMYATATDTGAEALKGALDKFQADNGALLEQLNDDSDIQEIQGEHWDSDWDVGVSDGEMDVDDGTVSESVGSIEESE